MAEASECTGTADQPPLENWQLLVAKVITFMVISSAVTPISTSISFSALDWSAHLFMNLASLPRNVVYNAQCVETSSPSAYCIPGLFMVKPAQRVGLLKVSF